MSNHSREIQNQVKKLFELYLEQTIDGQTHDSNAFIYKLPPEIQAPLRALIRDYRQLREQNQASVPLKAGSRLGGYSLIQELGRGAMASVWEAEHVSQRRRIALKVLSPDLSLSPQAFDRFQREAQAGRRLQHECIARTFTIGTADELHFIAQELVDGGVTLADLIAEMRALHKFNDVYYHAIARFFDKIAGALQHAHERGIIHRDIKPSNLLIADDFEPKVSDFGLAIVDDQGGLSRSGDLVGTPCYMSPEQAMSRRIGIDHRTDIFSLGASFYEALTLKRAFDGDNGPQLLHKIVMVDPPSPKAICSAIPRELSIICMKAIEKNPDSRYSNMRELADDLKRWLRMEPIHARPVNSFEWLIRLMETHPTHATLVLLNVVLWGASIAFATHYFVAQQQVDATRRDVRALELSRSQEEAKRELAESNREQLAQSLHDQSAIELLLDLQCMDPIEVATMFAPSLDAQTLFARNDEAFSALGISLFQGSSVSNIANEIRSIRNRNSDLGRKLVDAVYSMSVRLNLHLHSKSHLRFLEDFPAKWMSSLGDGHWEIEQQGVTSFYSLHKKLLGLIAELEDDAWRARVWFRFLDSANAIDKYESLMQSAEAAESGSDSAWLTDLIYISTLYACSEVEPPVSRRMIREVAALLRSCPYRHIPRTKEAYVSHYRLGQIAVLDLNFEDAIRHFTVAAAVRPESSSIHVLLARLYTLLGEEARARQAMQHDAVASAKSAFVTKWHFTCLLASAYLYVDPEMELRPASSESSAHWAAMSLVALVKGDREQAVEAIERAYAIDDAAAHILYCFGIVLLRLGDLQPTLRIATRLVENEPGLASAHALMGLVYCELGEFDQAEAAYRKAIDLDPNSWFLHYGIARVFHDMNAQGEALESIIQSIKLNAWYVPPSGQIGLEQARDSRAKVLVKDAIVLDWESNNANLIIDLPPKRFYIALERNTNRTWDNNGLVEAFASLGMKTSP